mmetsp:Transcript_11369/g.48485  ORF Transcript_11369/g.48485 Transcript_11369/m.48485 type:complete len:354 (-) Transcript_11369:1714-2775(-)
MTFRVSVPVLSDNTHDTAPSSSFSVVVRTPHFVSFSLSYSALSFEIRKHWITFTSSSVTYSEIGMSAFRSTTKRTNCVKNPSASAASTSGHTPEGARYQCRMVATLSPPRTFEPPAATSGFCRHSHLRCAPASAKPTSVWNRPTHMTNTFMCLSSLEVLRGARVALRISLVSPPVNTTTPKTNFALRSVEPRKSTLSAERPVSVSVSEEPPEEESSEVIHLPSNLYSWLLGDSHARRAFFCVKTETSASALSNSRNASRAPSIGAVVFTFKFVSPSKLAVSTYASELTSALATSNKSAGISASARTLATSPTFKSRHAVDSRTTRFFPSGDSSLTLTTSTVRAFTSASDLCLP